MTVRQRKVFNVLLVALVTIPMTLRVAGLGWYVVSAVALVLWLPQVGIVGIAKWNESKSQ